MSATDKIKSLQTTLGVTADGVFGPRSLEALEATIKSADSERLGGQTGLIASPGWAFQVEIEGEDLVIRNARVTCFGGEADKVDGVFHGDTASGFSTSKDPGYFGCALPLNRPGSKALDGSPIPQGIPWYHEVLFIDGDLTVKTKLVDIGPAKKTGAAGDLMLAPARLFDPKATVNSFERHLTIRIPGGAKYV